jgi:major type 1 subunit fimbrin (pilin)
MVNIMKLKLAALGLLSISSVIANADTIVDGGTVNFTGEFINAACAVSNESANQTVNLGQYRTASLQAAGDVTTNIPFNIVLNECDSTVADSVAVSFTGPSADGDLLAVNASGTNAQAAQGVGIELLDGRLQTLKVNGEQFSTAQTITDGKNTLNFFARYKSTEDTVLPGQANATATFKVQYQ